MVKLTVTCVAETENLGGGGGGGGQEPHFLINTNSLYAGCIQNECINNFHERPTFDMLSLPLCRMMKYCQHSGT